MAVIRFQGEGRGRSLAVPVNSSQGLQSKVWGKRRPAHPSLLPFDPFHHFSHPLRLTTSPLIVCLPSVMNSSFQHPCFSLSTGCSRHAWYLTPQSLHNYAHKYCEISFRANTTCCLPTLPCDTCQTWTHDLIHQKQSGNFSRFLIRRRQSAFCMHRRLQRL